MELKQYIEVELRNLDGILTKLLDSLTQQEIIWRPASGCNSIGLILYHMARTEDSFVNANIQGKPELWISEKWHEKLNMSETDPGAHYSVDQVNSFIMPDFSILLAYYNEVRAQTLNCLKSLQPDTFDKKIALPPTGNFRIGSVFAIIVAHISQHMGEISYLRGIQRGMDR